MKLITFFIGALLTVFAVETDVPKICDFSNPVLIDLTAGQEVPVCDAVADDPKLNMRYLHMDSRQTDTPILNLNIVPCAFDNQMATHKSISKGSAAAGGAAAQCFKNPTNETKLLFLYTEGAKNPGKIDIENVASGTYRQTFNLEWEEDLIRNEVTYFANSEKICKTSEPARFDAKPIVVPVCDATTLSLDYLGNSDTVLQLNMVPCAVFGKQQTHKSIGRQFPAGVIDSDCFPNPTTTSDTKVKFTYDAAAKIITTEIGEPAFSLTLVNPLKGVNKYTHTVIENSKATYGHNITFLEGEEVIGGTATCGTSEPADFVVGKSIVVPVCEATTLALTYLENTEKVLQLNMVPCGLSGKLDTHKSIGGTEPAGIREQDCFPNPTADSNTKLKFTYDGDQRITIEIADYIQEINQDLSAVQQYSHTLNEMTCALSNLKFIGISDILEVSVCDTADVTALTLQYLSSSVPVLTFNMVKCPVAGVPSTQRSFAKGIFSPAQEASECFNVDDAELKFAYTEGVPEPGKIDIIMTAGDADDVKGYAQTISLTSNDDLVTKKVTHVSYSLKGEIAGAFSAIPQMGVLALICAVHWR